MRYFIDTEFIEDGHTIDLISLAIVCEDGRFDQWISSEFDSSKADLWVRDNVLDKLPSQDVHPRRSRQRIRRSLLNFVGDDANPESWDDYAAYDWIAICQLFGKMIDLPYRWPMYINDIRQFASANLVSWNHLPTPHESTAHEALADAHNTKACWDLIEIKRQELFKDTLRRIRQIEDAKSPQVSNE